MSVKIDGKLLRKIKKGEVLSSEELDALNTVVEGQKILSTEKKNEDKKEEPKEEKSDEKKDDKKDDDKDESELKKDIDKADEKKEKEVADNSDKEKESSQPENIKKMETGDANKEAEDLELTEVDILRNKIRVLEEQAKKEKLASDENNFGERHKPVTHGKVIETQSGLK